MKSAITAEPRRISLVIPTWNGGGRYRQLLAALAEQDVEGGFQLVTVDSGSRDGTLEASRAAGALCRSIPQSEFNHGATRNLAISMSSGEIVLLLTQDAVPMDRHYVRAMVSAFDDPSIDGAYARQFPQADCDPLLAERLRRWSASRDSKVVQEFVAGDAEASRAKYESLEPLQRLFACAFDNVASSVRRSSWERQPFPHAPFGEDVSWAKAVLLAGGRIAFEPDARVEHSHRISIKREFKRLYCDHRNLHTLFGVRTVPTWKHVRQGWKPQRKYYAELLDAQPNLSSFEKWRWKRYADVYTFTEAAAQFLGARSHWKTQESAFWRWFDGKVRRGV
jgi:rhamnosyltransferase